MNSTIAGFPFVTLDRPPDFGAMNRAVRTRPGVTGAAVLNLGLWGKPFTVVALSTHATLAEALATYATGYLPTTAGPAVTLTWAGISLAQLNIRYHVLGVEIQEARAVAQGHGAQGPYGAIMRTAWTLQPA